MSPWVLALLVYAFVGSLFLYSLMTIAKQADERAEAAFRRHMARKP